MLVVSRPASLRRRSASVTSSAVSVSTPRWLTVPPAPGASNSTSLRGGSSMAKLA